jgi:endonuclease/exonuclease/phosphatase family metal-dependent hydrolase
MPFYKSIDGTSPHGKRTIQGLLLLKEKLKEIPIKTVDSSLLIATWNLREFGGAKAHGREDEPLFYIAEIINRFDLVAIQEVKDDLAALDRLMSILGPWWKYIISDISYGRQGNNERLCFVYDTRKIAHGGLVGELVPEMVKDESTGLLKSEFAFARSPFMLGLTAGWFKFTICSDHFYYGASSPDEPQRAEEARRITDLLKTRSKSQDKWGKSIILLGDFNVFSVDDPTFKALDDAGFKVPDAIKAKDTNLNKDKPFDQIAFYEGSTVDTIEIANAGVFDYSECVYRDDQEKEYGLGNYRTDRTYKMSDHLPLWVELKIDFSVEYLKKKRA